MKNYNKKTSNHNSNNAKRNTSKSTKDQSAIAQFLQSEAKPRPKLEESPIGVPLTMKVLGDPETDMPLLADEMQYGRKFKVEDVKIYTLRLGIQSNPNGPGAITVDSVGVLAIPTESASEIQITAIFAFEEIYPAVFGDSVVLCSDHKMHVEYIFNSTRLEPNNGLGGLTLDDSSLIMDYDMTFISYDDLGDRLPQPNITFAYDFITAQIKIKFDE